MTIRFTKMHSLGNDFMVIDGINQSISLDPALIRALSNRHTGVGFDQCLLIEKSQSPEIDFLYRIFNSDGTEVGQCGNGARCLARFVQHYKLSNKKQLNVATQTTKMSLTLHENTEVSVAFAEPQFAPKNIPIQAQDVHSDYTLSLRPEHPGLKEATRLKRSVFLSNEKDLGSNGTLSHPGGPSQSSRRQLLWEHQGELAENIEIKLHALSVGNPHAVLKVETYDGVDVPQVGRQISEHPFFPMQTNVSFMKCLSPEEIELKVYERGCGETLACGSAAVASAVIAIKFYAANERLKVKLPGGDLAVYWPKGQGRVYLRGPAAFVYEAALDSSFSILTM
jgi:diaminopimelate epimerase